MAGRAQAAFITLLVCGLVGAAGPVGAQSVPPPLPPKPPLPREGVPVPPSAVPSAPATSAPAAKPSVPTFDKNQWIPQGVQNLFGGPAKPKTTTALEPAQRALVDKVSGYLSSVHVLSGEFAQIGPDGRQTKGVFYIQKPGKVRFEYDPPSPIEIIADGSSVVVRDRRLDTKDLYPLKQTPLRFLLTDKIDLLKETNVTGVFADELFVTVVVEEKQVLVGTHRLMMMFDAKNLELKQWVITDPQGYDTTVALSKLDRTSRPDPSMFKIDYTAYPQ